MKSEETDAMAQLMGQRTWNVKAKYVWWPYSNSASGGRERVKNQHCTAFSTVSDAYARPFTGCDGDLIR